ncbi:septum site-determining protein MinC [Carnobacterium sp. ISL-102]|uniref:septum site-determining protein MinC n=1 Tax=Carnobacterium sp. ISL-102 TaxID=2819142 RepID=UPI001BED0C24|nr:septum site-determining protein MinC [Carnobacterium sp. ISL-102]MBT2731702.1 septum site-determining protein MinC [Carnobacterium sp. ISL-102]
MANILAEGVVKVKQSVTLKGTKGSFVLSLDEAASFVSIMKELNELLEHLNSEQKRSKEVQKEILLEIKTGNRLLSQEQQELIIEEINSNSTFSIKTITSSVVTVTKAIEWQKTVSLQMEVQTIRSGQVLTAPGNLLFIGKVHPGGVLRAKGSIFIIGELMGTAHAGFEGNINSVIVADFHTNAQIRIADSVQIVEKKNEHPDNVRKNEFAFINDLHILDFHSLEQLKKIRPNLDKVIGGLSEWV